MSEPTWLSLADRLVTLAERWYAEMYPQGEVFDERAPAVHRVGDTPAQPQTKEEYEAFPADIGRFERQIRASRSAT